jgi:hypothetical protein
VSAVVRITSFLLGLGGRQKAGGSGPISYRRKIWPLRALCLVLVCTFGLALPSPVPLEAQTPRTITQADVDLIEQQTQQVRELQATAPIPVGFFTRDELQSYLAQSIDDANNPDEIQANQYVLEMLGYVEPGVDLLAVIQAVDSEQIGGFYDHEKKILRVVVDPDSSLATTRVILSHEITHALQDQHFGLSDLEQSVKGNDDADLALTALIEGDAVIEELLFARRFLSATEYAEFLADSRAGDTTALDAAPLALQRELIFPYDDGAQFVAALVTRGGWDAVNDAWAHPPTSTAQILHPAKYRASTDPVEISLPDLTTVAGPDWHMLRENVIGELDCNILIEQYVNAKTADTACNGWAGDRYRALRRDADGALLFASTWIWDNPADAAEFMDAYQQLLANRYAGGIPIDGQPALPTGAAPTQTVAGAWQTANGAWYQMALRDGKRVTLVIASDPTAAAAVSAALRQ